MVIPVGPEAGPQKLYLLKKRNGKLVSIEIVPVRFVPLVHPAHLPHREGLRGQRQQGRLLLFVEAAQGPAPQAGSPKLTPQQDLSWER
jgi:hypothetical protein